MIAQWKNDCISLSVLSVARVMIAQWKNECISLSVLSVAWVMIAQWKNECISLSVLSVARVMIAQWKNKCIALSVLPVAWVQFPATAEYSKEFSLTDHTLHTHLSQLLSHHMAENGSSSTQWYHTT